MKLSSDGVGTSVALREMIMVNRRRKVSRGF